MPMLPKPSVVLFVNDVPVMSRFYVALAAMEMVHDAEDHAVLETHGVQLVIHAIPPAYREVVEPGAPVKVREDSYLKFCLPVTSIALARTTAEAHGGRIAPETAEWAAPEYRACDGNDPEGNVIQVREPIA